jgi:hypothetical protein
VDEGGLINVLGMWVWDFCYLHEKREEALFFGARMNGIYTFLLYDISHITLIIVKL